MSDKVRKRCHEPITDEACVGQVIRLCAVCGEPGWMDPQGEPQLTLSASPDNAGAVLHRCGGCGQREWVMPDPAASTVPQALHRAVVSRLTSEREAAMAEMAAVRDESQRRGAGDTWRHEVCVYDPENSRGFFGRVECEVADTGYADHGVALEPEEELVAKRHYDAAQGKAVALRERIEAAYRALEAAGEVVPRGPAGDTLADKITALVAILRRVEAERKEALDIIKGDARKLLMEMMGKG